MAPRGDSLPLAAVLALLTGLSASAAPRARLIAGFDEPGGSLAAGPHKALQRAPSTVVLRRIPDAGGHALEVSGRHSARGLAGVSLAFHDARAARRRFVD